MAANGYIIVAPNRRERRHRQSGRGARAGVRTGAAGGVGAECQRRQVGQDYGAGLAVHAAGLDEIVVGMAVDDLTLDAGHYL